MPPRSACPLASPPRRGRQTPAVVDLPDVTLPEEPAFPFWPERLPSPVPAPTAPAIPDYPALTTTAPVQVLDGQGPGCGWAFTGQPVPNFDAAAAASKAAVDAEKAADTLGRNVAAYSAGVGAYQAAYTRYLADVRAFQTYAQAVDTVAAAWKVIRLDQAEYREAMVLYTAALTARDLFLARQTAARTAYTTAVALCARGPIPTRAPTAAPTAVPTTRADWADRARSHDHPDHAGPWCAHQSRRRSPLRRRRPRCNPRPHRQTRVPPHNGAP